MSRKTYYKNENITVIHGTDHLLGQFFHIFDEKLMNETPVGEGFVLDWSEGFGYEVNITGIPNQINALSLVNEYIKDNVDLDKE